MRDGELPAVLSNIMTSRLDDVVSGGEADYEAHIERIVQERMSSIVSKWSARVDQLEAQRAISNQRQVQLEKSLAEMQHTMEVRTKVCGNKRRGYKSVSEFEHGGEDPPHEGESYAHGTQTSGSAQEVLSRGNSIPRPETSPLLIRQETQHVSTVETSVSTVFKPWSSRLLN